MTKKILSYIMGAFLGLLIIAPPIDYRIPLLINSFHWLYLVCASALFGFFLLYQKINFWLKALVVYLFASCFISQAPALSFNAFILVVCGLYLLIALRACDFKIIISFIEAAFWFEVMLCAFQIAGMDKLLCFDRAFALDPKTLGIVPVMGDTPKFVAFGTVMQYMRMASVFAVMAPFLLWKNKFYFLPLFILSVVMHSSSFAIALVAWVVVYFWFSDMSLKMKLFISVQLACYIAAYAVYDLDSVRGAILPANGGRLVSWLAVLKTWCLHTERLKVVSHLEGPFDWQWFFFGHGMDTFLPLFPIYKHDPNPFPQAHNDWLQMIWEIGAFGSSLVAAFLFGLVAWFRKNKMRELLAGCATIAVIMFFCFPMRMTQTMFLIVAYVALLEARMMKGKKYGI